MNKNGTICANITIIASKESWIEGEAIRQIEYTAGLDGMIKVVGLPDLHPGKGFPVGASFFSKGIFYPYLIGNDIGCGMAMWQTDLKKHKIKMERWIKKIPDLENPLMGEDGEQIREQIANENGLQKSRWDSALGTVGGGNHFAELQMIHSIENQELFDRFDLDKNTLFLLIHSGSRGLGEEILRAHIDRYKSSGLREDSDAAVEYYRRYEYAVQWAAVNREILARRIFLSLGADGEKRADLPHNTLDKIEIDGVSGWLHRKGAVSSASGLIVIAGSRGDFTYLVTPKGSQKENCFSLSHGAGRKWGRGESKNRLRKKYSHHSLLKTELGSRVICNDKNLLYEEAPQNYKNISTVITDLQNAGLIEVIAKVKPVITYKTRG